MDTKNKIAIVGAGIIGLYLGWQLQKRGFQVTVFEKKERVGAKPCSSLISERIRRFIPIPSGLVQGKVESVSVNFPRKKIRLKPRPPFLVLEREEIDEFVFNLAKKEGVQFVFGEEIMEIPRGFSKVVGCDGALSKMRKMISLSSPQFRLGIQYFVKTEESSSEIEIWPRIFKSSPRYGFFWKIFKEGKTEYGAIGSVNLVKEEFERFCEERGVTLEQRKIRAALIPQGIFLPNKRDITLCGDAAGLTKPTTGGGVIWGLTAADILLKNFTDFRGYKKEAERFFKPKIFKGKLATSLGYFLGIHFPLVLPKNISMDADLY